MEKIMRREVEVLAPAGSYETLKAAIDSGAVRGSERLSSVCGG